MNLEVKSPKEIMKYFMISITIYIIISFIDGITILSIFGSDPYYQMESMMYSGGSFAFQLIKGLFNFIGILYFILGAYHSISLILVAQNKLIKDNINSEEEISE